MATIKSYTDIEQSRKLAEFLSLGSADMCYIKHASSYNPNWEFNEDFPPMILGNVPINEITAETLPCWSLAALLDVLPEYDLQRTDWADKTENKIVVSTDEDNYASKNYDNPLDACVGIIERLHELDFL